jgi:zinc protease
MRRTWLKLTGLFLVVLVVIVQGVWAKGSFSQELYVKLTQTKNEIPQIKIPDYRKLVLKNGLLVYLVEDHEFPIVLTKGCIRGGRERETLQNAGISKLMVDLMNTGTLKYNEQELGCYTELHAVRFKLKACDQYFTFYGNALASDQDALLSLAAEMLCHPQFMTDYFSRIKAEREKGLKQMETMEDGLVNKYFYQNILPGHPYAFDMDNKRQLANLAKMTPDSLADYYHQTVLPNQTIFLVYGDFSLKQMEQAVEKYFGGWVRREVKPAAVEIAEQRATFGRILLVDKADAVQAKIKMGYRFLDVADFEEDLDEKVAFEVGDKIFGGGDFGSYLMDEIRSQKGYAYDIASGYFCQRLGGVYQINTRVRPDQACETVVTIKQIMRALKTGQKKVTEEEVFKLINRANALYPESFRYKDAIITSLIENVELKNHAANYFNQYIVAYNRVTAAKAQAALERWLFPEKLFTVIVGKKEDILPAFQKTGIKVDVVKD